MINIYIHVWFFIQVFFRVYIIHTFASFFYRETPQKKKPIYPCQRLNRPPQRNALQGWSGRTTATILLPWNAGPQKGSRIVFQPSSFRYVSFRKGIQCLYIIYESIHIEVRYEICIIINLCNLYLVFNASMNFDGHRNDLAKLL